MHYDVSIEIDAPRDQVVELFLNESRFREWQPDLIEYFPTSKQRGVEEATEWICTSEFRCEGMMRFVMFCMPWLFKRETHIHQERFKTFVEAAT